MTFSPLNDAPNFNLTGPNPPSVSENAGLQTVPGFAGNFTPGPATAIDEANQTLAMYNVAVASTTGNLAEPLDLSSAERGIDGAMKGADILVRQAVLVQLAVEAILIGEVGRDFAD